MLLLFTVELRDYMTPNVTEELFVDTSRSPSIQINLDVIFSTISCDCTYVVKIKTVVHENVWSAVISLDAMDSSGEQHLQIDHNIYKRRLSLEGNPIEDPVKEDITIKSKSVEVQTRIELVFK